MLLAYLLIAPDFIMEKPTRAEAVAHLLRVVKADYSSAVKKRKETCQDCGGLGVTFAKSKKGKGKDAAENDGESGDKVSHCHSCEGFGYVEVDAFDFDTLSDELKPLVQGFKIGPKGAILPDLASKDKAADQLLKVIGLGWGDDFQRDKYGSDIRPTKIDLSTKEGLISYYETIIAGAGDPNVKMTALKEIAKLRGFVTEDDESVDRTPLTMKDIGPMFNSLLLANGHKLPDAAIVAEVEDFPDDEFVTPVPDSDGNSWAEDELRGLE